MHTNMKLNDYQEQASKTAIYHEANKVIYPALGLAGEAGEVADKTKKILRDDNGFVTEARREGLKKEIGDCLWYIAAICRDLGLSLEDVAQTNLDKLNSRKERGVLGGSGDNR